MSFRDIKGQDRAIGILKENISSGRIFSAYLFVGPRGIGKAVAARNFAKAVNCLDKKNDACDACVSCRKIDAHVHPDIFFVEPKGISSSIGIGEIRSLIRRASLKPYEAKKKVFVINGAHFMNDQASNAFLKTLEETPADTIFILVSRSKEALLPTIVSRLHEVKFLTAAPGLVKKILSEKFNMETADSEILSNFSSGRIGEAIKMREKNLIKRKNCLIDGLLNLNGDFAEKIGSYSDKKELKESFEYLIAFFRDIFIYRATKNNTAIFNMDRLEEIRSSSKKFTFERLDYVIRKLITLRSYVDYNVNPKIIIDVLKIVVKPSQKEVSKCTK